MAKDRHDDRSKARAQKLTMKKAPVKDLEPKKDRDVKGGFGPIDSKTSGIKPTLP